MEENKKTTAEQVAEALENKTTLKLNATDAPEAERTELIKNHIKSILDRFQPGDALVVGYVSKYDEMRQEDKGGLMEFIAACDGAFASRVASNLVVSFEIHPMMLMVDMAEAASKPTRKPQE